MKKHPDESRVKEPVIGTHDNMLPVYERFARVGSNAELLGSALEFPSSATRIRSFFSGLPKGTKILDIGPGRGDESRLAVSLGHDVTGLDFSPAMQTLYHQNVPEAATVIGDMTAIPSELSEQFNVVFCSFSFLHLPREKGIQALAQFRKTLSVGGQLYLLTLIGEGKDEMNSGRDFLEKAGIVSWYFYHWNLTDLVEQIQKAGFQISGEPDRFQLVPGRPDVIAIRATAISV